MKYDFDAVTDRTHTNAVKLDLAKELGKPEDALCLWVADMDFRAAPCIQEALSERVLHGIYGYSSPDERYFNAVRKWFSARHHFDVEREWIVNTPGVCFALFAAVRAFTEKGESILVTKPVYYPFFNTIEMLGRHAVNSPLVLRNGHYEIDFSDFEEKIVKEKVRMFIFCSPHNPGGRVWTKDEIKKVSEICLKHGVLVLSDEIHCDITFDGHEHTVYGSVSREALENSVICTAPSKTFNLAGLQFSNIIIANPKLRSRFRAEVDRTGLSEPGIMGIVAAAAAYEGGGEWFDEVREYIWQNILFTEKYIGEHCPKIKVHKPEGTYLLWLDFTSFTECSDEEICSRMLNGAKVWLDEGSMFGEEGSKFQRLNCATPRSVLERALEQICTEFSERQ